MMSLREYVTIAIQRINAGQVSSESGSHLAGVFGKAAQMFEEEMRIFLDRVLLASGLSYEIELQSDVTGSPPFSKLTLGQILFCLKKLHESFHGCLKLSAERESGWSILCNNIDSINRRWVGLKHGKGIDKASACENLSRMLTSLNFTDTWTSAQP
jgi:hypothetical protein